MIFDKKIALKQWRIQDFPRGGAPTPKNAVIFQLFAENCMKMKEFGPPGGARVPGAPLGSANVKVYSKKFWSMTYFFQYNFHLHISASICESLRKMALLFNGQISDLS